MKRSRWAAFGAAIAVTVGSGGLMSASADVSSGDRPVLINITPCRVADTRPAPDNVGPRNTPLGAAETYTLMIRGTNGNCTIPADAVAIVLNVAAISPTASSFFTLFPADAASRPLSANLNFLGNQAPVSNGASIKLSADGRLSIFNLSGTVNFTIDILGYYVGHNHNDVYYTKAELDARQWTSANIADGTIATADLADNSVTSAKIVDATIALADLGANSVNGSKVVDNSLNTDDVAPLHGDNDIIDNTITTFDIATNAVDSDEVLDFGLTNQDVNVFYAVVNADGTLDRSSGGGVTSSQAGTGSYNIDFNRNIHTCSWVADTETGVGFTDVFQVGADPSEIVNVHHHSTAAGFPLTDGKIHLQVVC